MIGLVALLSLYLLGDLFVISALIFLIWSFLRGAPYVPSSPAAVEDMLRLADVRAGERMADLGSGDGRLVIAFARAGAEAHGFEANPVLVWWARRTIRRAGLEGRARIHWMSFWHADLSPFDVITIFGIDHIMAPLERKLRQELKPNARVVSNAFPFPNWEAKRSGGGVYLYRHP